MSLPVAILAGGLATRLRPITEVVPKSLVEVAGRPFVFHQVELLRQHGVEDIVLLVGHLGERVRDELGDGSRWGVRVRYIFDGPRQLGTGGAVNRALSSLGDPFFVLYGDSYLECDYRAVEQTFLLSGKLGLMTVCRNDDRWDRSNVLFVDSRIVRYDKLHRSPDMAHIDYGLGVFRHAAFAGWAEDEVFDLALVYQDLLARDALAGCEVPTRFYEIGSRDGLEETRAYLEHKGLEES
jgi:N-acetyl-alpha-D-muramate 1-phosphate uridylyltransferase